MPVRDDTLHIKLTAKKHTIDLFSCNFHQNKLAMIDIFVLRFSAVTVNSWKRKKDNRSHFLKMKRGFSGLVASLLLHHQRSTQTRRKSCRSSSSSLLLTGERRPVAIKPLLLLRLPVAAAAAAALTGCQLLLPAPGSESLLGAAQPGDLGAPLLLLQRLSWNSPAGNYWGGHSSVPVWAVSHLTPPLPPTPHSARVHSSE